MQKDTPAGGETQALESSSMLQRPHDCLLQPPLHLLQASNVVPLHCSRPKCPQQPPWLRTFHWCCLCSCRTDL